MATFLLDYLVSFQLTKILKSAMGDSYKIRDQTAMHFLTFTIVGWIDLFTRQVYRDVVIDSLRYCSLEKGLVIYGYVIMSNHMHLLVRAKEGFILFEIIRDFKKFTSKKFIATIGAEKESRREWMLSIFKEVGKSNSRNVSFQVWQQESHAVEVLSNDFMDQKLEYIHNNPVKAGLVRNSWEYIYSSASNYNGEKGLLEVELVG